MNSNNLVTKSEEEKEATALTIFGKRYVKLPRHSVLRLFTTTDDDHLVAGLHLSLMCFCNYADGSVCFHGKQVPCSSASPPD